jgi:ketosteroid isomerase-like protein
MKRMTAITLIAAAIFCAALLSTKVYGQDAEVMKVHTTFRDNWVKYDADAIGKMMADDIVWIGRTGTINDKAAMIEAFRQKRMTKSDHSKDVKVRMYGNVAIITEVNIGTSPDGTAPANTASTEVWNKKGNTWLLISFQGTIAPTS